MFVTFESGRPKFNGWQFTNRNELFGEILKFDVGKVTEYVEKEIKLAKERIKKHEEQKRKRIDAMMNLLMAEIDINNNSDQAQPNVNVNNNFDREKAITTMRKLPTFGFRQI